MLRKQRPGPAWIDLSMTQAHIYTAETQPATQWQPPVEDAPAIEWHPRRQIRCQVCRRLRWASKLSVQVYYDLIRIFCTVPCTKGRR